MGITLNVDWFEPLDSSNLSHVEACNTKLQFFAGWFANPIYIDGKYPEIMRQKVPIHNWLKLFLKEYSHIICAPTFSRGIILMFMLLKQECFKNISLQNFNPLCYSM